MHSHHNLIGVCLNSLNLSLCFGLVSCANCVQQNTGHKKKVTQIHPRGEKETSSVGLRVCWVFRASVQ